MSRAYRIRRVVLAISALAALAVVIVRSPDTWQSQPAQIQDNESVSSVPTGAAVDALANLPVKGKAPKTGYTRTQFGDGWAILNGCDTRNIILNRDLKSAVIGESCKVLSGVLDDPYTGRVIQFSRGASTSDQVQIDHVVALSNAWQTGAQQLTAAEREQLANDPLELLAVDGAANQQKSDGDAATWLPTNKAFRCQYVARQIAVKQKYRLWIVSAEREAMLKVLANCPGQQLPAA